MKVTDRHGRTWTIRRHWLRRDPGRGISARWRAARERRAARRRGRRSDDDGSSWFDWIPIPDDFLIVIAGVLAIVVFVFFGVPLLLGLFDLVFLLIMSVGGVIGRVLFRRPWTVEAVSDRGDRRELQVVGLRNSGLAKRTLASEVLRLEPPSFELRSGS